MTEDLPLNEHTEYRVQADATVAAFEAGEYPRDALVTLVALGHRMHNEFLQKVIVGGTRVTNLSAADKARALTHLQVHGEDRWERP